MKETEAQFEAKKQFAQKLFRDHTNISAEEVNRRVKKRFGSRLGTSRLKEQRDLARGAQQAHPLVRSLPVNDQLALPDEIRQTVVRLLVQMREHGLRDMVVSPYRRPAVEWAVYMPQRGQADLAGTVAPPPETADGAVTH